MLRKFMIEREINDVGSWGAADLGDAAQTSNKALSALKGVQWQHTYVTGDKTFCVYLAESEEGIREHSRLSGFPASKITEITGVIDPTTERQRQVTEAAA